MDKAKSRAERQEDQRRRKPRGNRRKQANATGRTRSGGKCQGKAGNRVRNFVGQNAGALSNSFRGNKSATLIFMHEKPLSRVELCRTLSDSFRNRVEHCRTLSDKILKADFRFFGVLSSRISCFSARRFAESARRIFKKPCFKFLSFRTVQSKNGVPCSRFSRFSFLDF